MKTIRILSIFALIALLVMPAASAFAQDTATPAAASTPAAPAAGATATAPAQPPTPLLGQATWIQYCAPCHGTTGKGDGPSAAQLNAQPAKLGDYNTVAGKTLQDLFNVTKNGRMDKMMPPWGKQLGDQEIWDVVGYAWSLHSSRDEVTQGKAVYDANCASCHGANGKPAQNGVPDLSDFAKTSQVSETQWADAVAKGKGTMPAFGGKLSDADQKAVLTYSRQLSMSGPLFREPLTKGTGVISGTITNKTINKPLGAMTVTLGIFDQVSQLEQRTGKTDANGFYKFDELPTDPTLAYAVRAEYPANVPYTSQFISFTADQKAIDAPISVYETTTDGSGITAEQVHYIVEFDTTGTAGARALVAELVVLSLAGDKTYVGDGNHVLAFPLPAGATELNVNDGAMGDRFLQANNGFVDREPLTPGQGTRQILFRYALPYNGSTLDLVRSLPYPAKAVNALVSDAGEKVTSPDLTDNGRRDTTQGAYYNFSATDWPANKQVRLNITNLPSGTGTGVAAAGAAAATGVGGMNKALIFGLIALAAGIAAIIVALPIIRNRTRPGLAGNTPGLFEKPGMSSQELVDALAELDRAYEAGEIRETAYRDERMRLKAQLRDVMQRERA